MKVLSQDEANSITATTHQQQPPNPAADKLRHLRVYMMDMWSFIPYYMGRLCASLQDESVKVTLGSVRYHLDREYFRKTRLSPDRWLLDVGGRFRRPNLLRRVAKACEYVFNLFGLGLRFSISKPDILHVQYLPFVEHQLPFEIWFLRWVRRLGIPIVYTVHNVTAQDKPDQGRPLYRRAYTAANALICHGYEARAELVRDFGIAAEKIWVIPHGPLFEDRPQLSPQEARLALGLPSEAPLVLLFGVISEYKGVPFLLNAWKEFIRLGGKGRLVIAGTGEPCVLSAIEEKVATEGLGTSVELRLRFIPVEELPRLCQAADILVYPYQAGTTSGALLTGLKYEKAIVATKLPFFREYLEDGRTAALVDYGDVEALASSLLNLTGRPEERARIATALSRQSSRGVTWMEIARRTRQCYETVLSTARGSCRSQD